MKDNLLNAERWLKQARHDLQIAERHLKNKSYSDACFMAEQAAQKALKAFLFFCGERSVPVHALVKLTQEAFKKDGEFKRLEHSARVLDKYYIPTRYPDALPMPAVPYEVYDEEDAKEAVACAREILELVTNKI